MKSEINDMDELCRGCFSYENEGTYCFLNANNIRECPCINCIVKAMCKTPPGGKETICPKLKEVWENHSSYKGSHHE